MQPVGPVPFGHHRADRIVERRDILQPLGHGLNPRIVQHQPVEQRARGAVFRRRRQILFIGGEQGGL